MGYNFGDQRKLNLNEIQVFQNITLIKINNSSFFVSNLTHYQDLDDQPIISLSGIILPTGFR
jgi:hypothetical protein